jgi:hypothetical protein
MNHGLGILTDLDDIRCLLWPVKRQSSLLGLVFNLERDQSPSNGQIEAPRTMQRSSIQKESWAGDVQLYGGEKQKPKHVFA